MGKITNKNYYVVHGWMINDLKLKGLELSLYAIIYGFSQADDAAYTGSLQYLADFTNSTKNGVARALGALVEKGFLFKTAQTVEGVRYVKYKAGGIQLSCTGYTTKLHGGIQLSCTNNINDIYNNNKEVAPERPATPTKEKSVKYLVSLPIEKQYELVQNYANKAALVFDVKYFVDWWGARNWVPKGRSKPLTDWQATARNWARKEGQYNRPQNNGAIWGNENNCANKYKGMFDDF